MAAGWRYGRREVLAKGYNPNPARAAPARLVPAAVLRMNARHSASDTSVASRGGAGQSIQVDCPASRRAKLSPGPPDSA